MDKDLNNIQTLLSQWVSKRSPDEVIPAVLFTADGFVIVTHASGETEVLNERMALTLKGRH